jgi:RNA polymerase sigma-70 factor (ECF subfamily)
VGTAGIFFPPVSRYNLAMSPQFASTHWSVVLAAKEGASEEAHAALASLCATYWRPLYAYVRRSGHSVEDAQDLTQSFFSRLIERQSLRRVDPALGKFRAFLLAALKNFLANEWRRDQAEKRGGTSQVVSFEDMTRAEDLYASGRNRSDSPEQLYERNWALALLERTTTRLAAEFEAARKAHLFAVLKPYLTGDRKGGYSEAAADLGLSEVAIRVAVHRMRGRFRDLLVQEVSRTLPESPTPDTLEDELRYLLGVLR